MMLRKLLAMLLLAVPMAARADWYEASTGHFTVFSEQPPEVLRAFATRLERFDKGVREMRGLADPAVAPANRVTVYVVDDRNDVAKLAGSSSVAGFYRPRAGGTLAIVPRKSGSGEKWELGALTILLHEYSHHIMWTIDPNSAFPAWFAEGFAEFHATAKFGRDGSVTFGEPPLYRAYGLMSGNVLPAEKLLVADTLKLDGEQMDGLYGRGWLLTHYLTFAAKERKGQLGAYVTAINRGQSPKEAARTFGDLRQLDRELESYKVRRMNVLTVPAASLQIGEVAIRKLTPGESATMDVRIRSKNGVSEKTAPGVYAAARKAAERFPNDRGAQLVLAEAAYDAGDYATAEAAADRAIAADAKAVDGYLYKAMCRMAVARKASDWSAATWNAIRKTIIAGNRIDPQNPEPLTLYYDSFTQQGAPVPEIAKDGLNSAFEFAPQDPALRLRTAAMFLIDRHPGQARRLLAPLAFAPHGRGTAKFAAALIEKIDAGDIDGAIATLKKGQDVKDED